MTTSHRTLHRRPIDRADYLREIKFVLETGTDAERALLLMLEISFWKSTKAGGGRDPETCDAIVAELERDLADTRMRLRAVVEDYERLSHAG